MKRNIPAFLSGALTTALVSAVAVSALAASGRMTIEVDPINVQVNGEVFQPKDANGNDVPVFSYNGTTYAPLRALAEAYGLEVGYDAGSNMATVGKAYVKPEVTPEPTKAPDTTAKADYSDWSEEDEAAYQEFKGMWEYNTSDKWTSIAAYNGDKQATELVDFLKEYDEETLGKYGLRIYTEILIDMSSNHLNFQHGDRILFGVYPDGMIRYGSVWSAGK